MIENKFKAIVEERNVEKIQSYFFVNFNLQRNSEKFSISDYAIYADAELNRHGIHFFAADNGETCFVSDSSSWDKKLWTDLRIELEYNFSREKFNNIVSVMTHLRESGHPDFQLKITSPKNAASSKTHSAESSSHQDSSNYSQKNFGLGALGGGLAGGVIGKMVGLTFGGVVLGVAVGLAAVYYLNQRNDE
jgi:hypothetical protein